MPMNSQISFASASELISLIKAGELGSRELLECYIQRFEEYNPGLGAIVSTRLDEARHEADLADEARKHGENDKPLNGLPMTVKESFQVAGMPTTWGLERFSKNISDVDAFSVIQLRKAGAVIFGKTNVPPLLADWQTYNPIYGVCRNPWNLECSPGGSSGGAAAALAAGLTGLEMGTDIGASIRNPAHYCGVYGHKPTYGIVNQFGHSPTHLVAEPDLGVTGPLARSAHDLELALDVISGPGDVDRRAWRLQLPPARHKSLAEYRIAILADAVQAPVDSDVASRLNHLVEFLAASGARISDQAWPDIDMDEMHRIYLQLLRAATSRRYSSDEVHAFREQVGQRPSKTSDYWQITREATVMGHRDWLLINEFRHRMRMAWDIFFKEYDLIICPVAVTAAMLHDHSEPRHERLIDVDGKMVSSIDQMFWAGIATLAYLPATSIPIGLGNKGLPIGAQIIGPQYGDKDTIQLAKLLEDDYLSFQPPPAYCMA